MLGVGVVGRPRCREEKGESHASPFSPLSAPGTDTDVLLVLSNVKVGGEYRRPISQQRQRRRELHPD
jgi:hypothetical protein